MRIQSILLGVLATATACGSCPKGGSKSPFSKDVTLTEEQLAEFERWLNGDTGSDGTSAQEAACEELCTWVQGGWDLEIEECEVAFFATTAELSCSGNTVTYCEGRRPRGHCDRPTARRPGLARTLAHFAELEAASVEAFEALAQELSARGAPPALVARCLAAAEDERRHTVRMGGAARRLGARPRVPQRRATASPSLLELALHNATEGCVAETFAALLAHHHAAHATDARLRTLFAPIAADETRHAQLAWDLHEWFRSQLSAAERAQVDGALAAALAQLPAKASQLGEQLPPSLGVDAPTSQALARSLSETLAA